MSYQWSNIIPRIIDGVTRFGASGLNPILDALENRTLYLKTHLERLENSNCGLVYTDRGFSPEVVAKGKGTILAWDAKKSQYIPASAKFDTNIREDGSVAPADSSYVIGILITDVVDGYGTILAHGWSSDLELISIVTGGKSSVEDPTGLNGAYYLYDDGEARKGEAADFDLPVYCFTYTGTGKLIVNPRVPEFTGHSHSKFIFTNNWEKVGLVDLPTSVADAIGDSGEVFCKYSVDLDDTGSLKRMLLECVSSKAMLTNDGVAVNSTDWAFTKDAVYVAFDTTVSSEIVLYTIAPLIGVEPLVRTLSVVGDSKIIQTNRDSGYVSLMFNDNTTALDSYTGSAIGAISNGDGIQTTPVVHTLGAGIGIHITHAVDAQGRDVPGVFVIHSTDRSCNQIDMNVCNLDGVLFGTDIDKVSYKFSAGMTSSLYGVFRVPRHDSNTQYTGKINVIVKGNGGTVSDGTVAVTTIPMPSSDNPVTAYTNAEYTLTGLTSSALEKYYLLTVPLATGSCPSDALLNCKLTFESPDAPVTVVGISLQLLDN